MEEYYSKQTLKVNNDWAGKTDGEQVLDGYYYNRNAFSTFDDALNAFEDGVTTEFSVYGDVEGNFTTDAWLKSSKDVSFTSGDGGAASIVLNFVAGKDIVMESATPDAMTTFTVGENVLLKNNTSERVVYIGYNNPAKMVVDGELSGYVVYAFMSDMDITATGKVDAYGEQLHVRFNTNVTITGEAAQGQTFEEMKARDIQGIAGYLKVEDNAVFTVKDTAFKVKAGAIQIDAVRAGTSGAKMILDNAYLNDTGHPDGMTPKENWNYTRVASDAQLILKNGSFMEMTACRNLPSTMTISEQASVSLEGNSKMAGYIIVNNGTFKVEDSTLDCVSFDNQGTLSVSGNSKILGAITGAITLTDGTVLADSALNGGEFSIEDGATVGIIGTGFKANSIKNVLAAPVEGYTLNIGNGTDACDVQVANLMVAAADTVVFDKVSNTATDAGSYLIQGAADIKNGSFIAQETVTVAGDVAIDGTSGLTAKTLTVQANGAIDIAAGGKLSAVSLTNAGTIDTVLGTTPAISFNGTWSNTGVINVDMGATTALTCKVVDFTPGEGSITDYGNVILSNAAYELAIMDNDLYAVNVSVIQVNTAWTDEAAFNASSASADGYVWNVNAFGSLEAATAQAGTGSKTYMFVNGTEAMMDLTVTAQGASPAITVTQGTAALSSFTVGSSVTKSFGIAAETPVVIAVKGDSAVYGMSAKLTEVQVNPEAPKEIVIPVAGETKVEEGHVGYKSGQMEYDIALGAGQSGIFAFSFKITDPDVEGVNMDYITYSIVDADGKVVTYGTTSDSVVRTVELTEGQYNIVVDSYDHGEGKSNSDFEVSVTTVKLNQNVTHDDDSFMDTVLELACSGEGSTASLSNFVGLGDEQDWIKVNVTSSGVYDLAFKTSEPEETEGAHVYLYEVEDATDALSRKHVVADLVYRGVDASIKGVALKAGNDYFVKVKTTSAYTSNNDATYTIDLTEKKAVAGINDTDDAWTSAQILAADTLKEDWVGTVDECDWYKLTTVLGENTLELTADGGLLNAQLYAKKADGEKLVGFDGPLYCRDGKNISKTFACAEGYEYYVRFTTQNTYDTNYKVKIAAAI